MKRRVFGYARQTEHQSGGGVSATRQKALVEAFAAKYLQSEDHRWIGFFADRATAGGTPLSERKMGQKLCLLLDRGDVLVVYDLALMFSSVFDGTYCMGQWLNRGVRIVSLNGDIDTGALDAEGVGQLARILSDIAGLSRAEHAERIKAGMDKARAEGRALNKAKPLGQKLRRQRGKTYLEPDPEERRIMGMIVSMHDEEGLMFIRVAARLHKLGLRRNGRRWSPQMCQKACRRELELREREAADKEPPTSGLDA